MTPALSHEDANARLLDLVYGEAAPAERAALEAHVATCARCTADLAALGGTRAHVRTALDDDAPVPARAHARILEAAKAELASAGLAKAEPASAPVLAPPARAVVPARAPSLWERLRRGWTLPTFATVGAVAVVVLASKVFLEPQRTMERGREVATAPAPVPATPEAPMEAKEKKPSADEQDRARIAAPSPEPAPSGAPTDGTASLRRHGVATRPSRSRLGSDPGTLGHVGGLGAGSGGLGAGSGRGVGSSVGAGTGSVAPASPPSRATARDDLLEGGDARAKPSAKAEAAGAAANEPYASPPSGWKGGAPAPAPPRAQDSPVEERSAAAPSALAKKKMTPAAEPSEANLEAPKSARAEADKDTESERKSDEGALQQTLARRADALFAARRWSEAIAAYRELLRVFPEADQRTRWRERLTQSQAEASPPTKDAKATKAAGKAASKKPSVEPTPAAE